MNLEIILKNKKVFIIFLLISFSGGIIESFIRKVNYRVEMGYAYNNAPIGAILNCENDGSVSTRCLQEYHLKKTVRYLNSQIDLDEGIGGYWDFNNETIYRYITTSPKDLKFLSKSIKSQFNDLKKKHDIENTKKALTIKEALVSPESFKLLYLDDDNISSISYQLFKFHFFVNTASNIASENFSVVDYYGPEYKVSIFDNKKYRLIIWLIFGFFVSLAFIILKEKRS